MALFSNEKLHTGKVLTSKTLATDETTPKEDMLGKSEFDVSNEDYEDDMLFGRSGIERNLQDKDTVPASHVPNNASTQGLESHYPRTNRKKS